MGSWQPFLEAVPASRRRHRHWVLRRRGAACMRGHHPQLRLHRPTRPSPRARGRRGSQGSRVSARAAAASVAVAAPAVAVAVAVAVAGARSQHNARRAAEPRPQSGPSALYSARCRDHLAAPLWLDCLANCSSVR